MSILFLVLGCAGGVEPASPPPEPPPEAPAAPPDPAPLPPPTEDRYAATHVLVSWAGAEGAPAATRRSRDEARSLAEQIRDRALQGVALEDLAREHSDGPSGPRGGALGVYRTGTMVPAFEAAVASVDVGGIGPLVESPWGFHVVRRDAVRQIEARHVVVRHADAWRSTETRTAAEARARAEQALAALDAGTPFEAVAAEYSDDATAAHGGDLGVIAPGQLIPAFEAAAFALGPGERSGVVETPYGFHVIERTR